MLDYRFIKWKMDSLWWTSQGLLLVSCANAHVGCRRFPCRLLNEMIILQRSFTNKTAREDLWRTYFQNQIKLLSRTSWGGNRWISFSFWYQYLLKTPTNERGNKWAGYTSIRTSRETFQNKNQRRQAQIISSTRLKFEKQNGLISMTGKW